jgi:CheY-like chemotaxis protein
LTVVKKLVELHGGTISARSDGAGMGSEFSVRLPAAKAPAPVKTPAIGQAGTPTRRARILIVDDNVDMATGMVRLLTLVGHDAETAYDGPTAIAAARAIHPEIVFLDIGLPGMDGYEVAAILRHDGCCRDAVFIAISGYGQDEDIRRSKQAGFDHHLVKPIEHEVLLTLISPAAPR